MIRSFLSPQLFNIHLETLLKESDCQNVRESVQSRNRSLLTFLKANWAVCLFSLNFVAGDRRRK